MTELYERFGKAKLPPGYAVFRVDSGHFMWVAFDGDDPSEYHTESVIDWDRWNVWRGAWADSRRPREAP